MSLSENETGSPELPTGSLVLSTSPVTETCPAQLAMDTSGPQDDLTERLSGDLDAFVQSKTCDEDVINISSSSASLSVSLDREQDCGLDSEALQSSSVVSNNDTAIEIIDSSHNTSSSSPILIQEKSDENLSLRLSSDEISIVSESDDVQGSAKLQNLENVNSSTSSSSPWPTSSVSVPKEVKATKRNINDFLVSSAKCNSPADKHLGLDRRSGSVQDAPITSIKVEPMDVETPIICDKEKSISPSKERFETTSKNKKPSLPAFGFTEELLPAPTESTPKVSKSRSFEESVVKASDRTGLRESTLDAFYDSPTEAEKQEEMMTMQRGCVEESNQVSPCVKTDLPKGNENSVSTNIDLSIVKQEPKDHETYPNSDCGQKQPTLITALEKKKSMPLSDVNISEAFSLSYEKVTAAPKLVNNGFPESKKNTALDSQTKKPVKVPEAVSSEVMKLDCVISPEISPYTPAAIPTKFRDSFPSETFKCPACGDSFLFKSSLDIHLSRQAVRIQCKHNFCLKSTEEFTNRCSYLIHLRHHGKAAPDVNFEIKSATENMINDLVETVQVTESKNYLSDLKAKLDYTWKCSECDKPLESATALAAHFSPPDQNTFSHMCTHCNKHFSTKCSLSAHERNHKKKQPFVCPQCGQRFLGTHECFTKHLGVHCFQLFREAVLKCPKCNFTESSRAKLIQHVSTHREVYYKCIKCPMAFRTYNNVQKHMTSCHGHQWDVSCGQVYKCTLCETVFHNMSSLTAHISSHVDTSNKQPKYCFKCWFCPKLFENVPNLKAHLTIDHRVRHSRLMCDICGKDQETLEDLCTHLSCHTDATGRRVSVAAPEIIRNKVPPQKIKLIKPAKPTVKSQAAPIYFKCSVCDFKCVKSNIPEIHSHIRKHRTEGAYICPICFTAVFDTFNDLHRHQFLCRKKRAQQKEASSKPVSGELVSCQKCPNKFSNDAALAVHMETEHGAGPQFPCHLCGLTYDTRDNLHQHIQLVHEGKKHLYLCWICQSKNRKRTFTVASKLEKHLIVKHRVAKNIIDPEKFPRLLPGVNQKDIVIDGASVEGADKDLKQAPIKRLKLADDAVFRCAKCEFSSENRDEFEAHIRNHKAESSSRQCPECGLCFSVLPSLKKHLIMVHKIKDISTYVRSSGLDESKVSEPTVNVSSEAESEVSPTKGNPLECRVCHKTFDNTTALKTHMRTHGMAFIRSKRTLSINTVHSSESN